MLAPNGCAIGEKLLAFRKQRGLTQADVAERAGLSDRAYAEIERGTVNMRVSSLLKICEVLRVTPNDLLLADPPSVPPTEKDIADRLRQCTAAEQNTAKTLLSVYLDSLQK